MLPQEKQQAANIVHGEAAQAPIDLRRPATTTATTTRSPARACTTIQLRIPKPKRLPLIARGNNQLYNGLSTSIPPVEAIEVEQADEEAL